VYEPVKYSYTGYYSKGIFLVQVFTLHFTRLQYCPTSVFSPVFLTSALRGQFTDFSLKDRCRKIHWVLDLVLIPVIRYI